LKEAATSNIANALRQGATVIGGVAYLFVVSWKLTLIMLLIVPAVAVCARLYGRFAKKLSKETRTALAEASEVAEESMVRIHTCCLLNAAGFIRCYGLQSNLRTVRSFAHEAAQEASYDVKINETQRLGVRSAIASGAFAGGMMAATSLSFVAIIAFGGSLVLAGEISSGVLTSFLLYALTIGSSLAGLAGLFGSVMSAVGANDRVFQILDRQPLVPLDGVSVLFGVAELTHLVPLQKGRLFLIFTAMSNSRMFLLRKFVHRGFDIYNRCITRYPAGTLHGLIRLS
jgi:ATP-binding cassette subfamily B protein